MNNKIKVLIVFRDYLSRDRGTPLRVKSLLSEISKDEEIELFTATRDEESFLGEKHLHLTPSNLNSIFRLQRFIKENKIRVVVFHTIAAGYFILPLFLFGGRYKRVLEMHGFFEEEAVLYNDISSIKYYRNKFFYSVIYKMCHLITTCSETARDKLLKYNNNTYTIYGGVDLDLFRPCANETGMVSEIVDSEIVIGYAGNARKWQGLEFLLDSYRELYRRDKNFALKLLLSEKVNHLDMTGVTVYPPLPHNEVIKFNSECDVLVIPRLDNEVNRLSFPSKLMEYLASGKPVVGSKTSDIHRIIVHGETGMLFRPGDVEDFIECMLKLKDPLLRMKLGRNGLKLAETGYSWEIQGKKFANLIKNVS